MLTFSTIFTMSETTWILLILGAMILFGFLGSRLTKLLHLPNVTAYILIGVLIGPSVLHLFPVEITQKMEFITDIALSFIAFGVGGFFKKDVLKQSGKKIIVITIFEALFAAVLITCLMYFVFHFSLSFSLILGAIASSTAPASTIMTIKQTKAKGEFVNTLLQVVALDDLVSLLAFSVAIAVSNAISSGGISFVSVILPILLNIGSIVLGFLLGVIAHYSFKVVKNKDYRLLILLAAILLNGAICSIINVSPLLSCMMFGMAYVNFSNDETAFKQVDHFATPILLLFFVYSGMKLSLTSLLTLGIPGLLYFIVRIAGKYAGASLGSVVTKSSKETTKYLGLGLIPQAGVSIGLAALGARNLPADLGSMLTTIILASSVLYELVGPACSKFALFITRSYDVDRLRREKQMLKLFKAQKHNQNIEIQCFGETTTAGQDEAVAHSTSVQNKIYHRNR